MFFKNGLVLALGLVLVLAVGLKAAETYQLKPEVVVNGPIFTAGDVLQPRPQGDLAKVSLGRVGKPGSVHDLTLEQVLGRVGREMRARAPQIQGTHCLVKASRRLVEGKDLIEFGRSTIRKHFGDLPEEARISIDDPPVPASMAVPDRPVVLHADDFRRIQWRGRVILKVDALQTDEAGQTVTAASTTLSFLVKVMAKALVATRPISRGQAIGPDNAALADKDITYEVEEPLGDTSTVFGLNAKRAVPPGALITPSLVELPFLVKRGDEVQLLVKSGPIQVQTLAKALRDGRKGDTVPVETLGNKKDLTARVVDLGKVEALAP